jgi:hypothetical protein
MASKITSHLVLSALMMIASISTASGDQSLPTRTASELLSLSVTPDNTTYHVGQPIRFRIQVTNKSSYDASVFDQNPALLVGLVIKDENGTMLSTVGYNLNQCKSICSMDIGAGATSTASWDGSEWFDLSRWGYAIGKPGTYSIEVYPRLDGLYWLANAPASHDGPDVGRLAPDVHPVPSNSITIHVTS